MALRAIRARWRRELTASTDMFRRRAIASWVSPARYFNVSASRWRGKRGKRGRHDLPDFLPFQDVIRQGRVPVEGLEEGMEILLDLSEQDFHTRLDAPVPVVVGQAPPGDAAEPQPETAAGFVAAEILPGARKDILGQFLGVGMVPVDPAIEVVVQGFEIPPEQDPAGVGIPPEDPGHEGVVVGKDVSHGLCPICAAARVWLSDILKKIAER